jgi:demethylmenaquinone methyltransferase/2-methoxy-6-polyprenyl-1,4-benzoquinol methylase
MADPGERRRADEVRHMFARIAWRYDLMNRLMTAAQDVRWRRETVRRAALPADGRLLDLGAGTGDLAQEALRQYPLARVVAADFTLEMMQVGRQRPSPQPHWLAADALRLPFADETFDAVVSGFLLRNVTNLDQALREQWRVLKVGGKMVSLDTTRPPRNLLTPFIQFHFRYLIPALGRWISGDAQAYAYLPASTQSFLSAERLAERMLLAGFQQVGFHRRMFGTVAIHWGIKPSG